MHSKYSLLDHGLNDCWFEDFVWQWILHLEWVVGPLLQMSGTKGGNELLWWTSYTIKWNPLQQFFHSSWFQAAKYATWSSHEYINFCTLVLGTLMFGYNGCPRPSRTLALTRMGRVRVCVCVDPARTMCKRLDHPYFSWCRIFCRSHCPFFQCCLYTGQYNCSATSLNQFNPSLSCWQGCFLNPQDFA